MDANNQLLLYLSPVLHSLVSADRLCALPLSSVLLQKSLFALAFGAKAFLVLGRDRPAIRKDPNPRLVVFHRNVHFFIEPTTHLLFP